MNMKAILKLTFLGLLLPGVVGAEPVDELLSKLQQDWAVANYELTGKAQLQAYESLIEQSESAVRQHADSAEILVWNGIIKSSFAGAKGGVGALSYAKQAKKSLEAAMKISDMVLQGSAYTSLGTLYFKVPGWPLGFGNDEKAEQLLKKALEINPDGIDSNYFYADYLLDKKDYVNAEKYFLKAQHAPPRENRSLADAGRQREIMAALAKVREKLGHSG